MWNWLFSPLNITEYNEVFHDSVFNVTSANSVAAPHLFLETTVVNPFLDHAVCPLSTSIDEPLTVAENAIGIFPNPASELLTLKLNNGENLKALRIFSADGRELYSEKFIDPKRTFTFQTAFLPSGVYFLECVSNSHIGKGKFVKY